MATIVHLSDLHLLASPREQEVIFDELILALEHVREHSSQPVGLLAITGDVFDSAAVDVDMATHRFADLHKEMCLALGRDVPTVIVPGNHDRRDALSIDTLSYAWKADSSSRRARRALVRARRKGSQWQVEPLQQVSLSDEGPRLVLNSARCKLQASVTQPGRWDYVCERAVQKAPEVALHRYVEQAGWKIQCRSSEVPSQARSSLQRTAAPREPCCGSIGGSIAAGRALERARPRSRALDSETPTSAGT